MENRKLISKFVTSIFEKNYAQANNELSEIISEKMKSKIKKLTGKKDCDCNCKDCKNKNKKNIKKVTKKG